MGRKHRPALNSLGVKYLILIAGVILIWVWKQELLEDGIGCMGVLILCLLYIVLWLLVFFVFDLTLPPVTL